VVLEDPALVDGGLRSVLDKPDFLKESDLEDPLLAGGLLGFDRSLECFLFPDFVFLGSEDF
jgi:hypothetical protein